MRLLVILLIRSLRALVRLVALPARLLRLGRRPRWVRFRLKGDPPYRGRGRQLGGAREPADVESLEALAEHLDVLARDPRLEGVLFTLEGLEVATAKREALAELIRSFRAKGKRALGHALQASTSEYALLCACEAIYVPRGGRVELSGFATESMALGKLLKRLGVGAHFVRRGEHKTAPEMFTDEVTSENHRAMLGRLLDAELEALLQALALRGIAGDEARALIDGGPYGARRALEEKLIDGLASEVDLARALYQGKLEELSTPRPLPAREERRRAADDRAGKSPDDRRRGAREPDEDELSEHEEVDNYEVWQQHRLWPTTRSPSLRRPARLGVVELKGMILPGDGGGLPIGPKAASSGDLVKRIRAARRDPRTAALLLHIDSPGGSAMASEAIVEEIERLAAEKPVVAFFDRVAASGGYLAALGADELWAGPNAVVGSIGVYGGKIEVSGLLELLGVHRELQVRGENAGMLSPSRPFTASERQALEAEIEETYQAFLERVAHARGFSAEEALARAGGRVYSAKAAREERLIDAIGGYEEAAARALSLAGLDPSRIRGAEHVPFEPPRSIGWRLLRPLGGARSLERLLEVRLWAMAEGDPFAALR